MSHLTVGGTIVIFLLISGTNVTVAEMSLWD